MSLRRFSEIFKSCLSVQLSTASQVVCINSAGKTSVIFYAS
jgi:hypothetical protein